MLIYIVFQQLMSYNHIFPDQFIEIFYIIIGEFAVVSNYFQRKPRGGYTGFALTKFSLIIYDQRPVKFTKHFLDLFIQICRLRRFTEFVKKNSIAFNF